MRIYMSVIMRFKRAIQVSSTAVIKSETAETAKQELMAYAQKKYPTGDGFLDHYVGEIDDITDSVRRLLREIDEE